MRIVIDARMLYWTGIGRYTKALLHELAQIDHENQYVVLVRRADWKLWEPEADNFVKVESSVNPYSLAEQWQLYLQLKALAPDLVHFTAPNAPLLYAGKRVTTIHDLTLLDFNTARGSGIMKWVRGLKQLPFRLVLTTDVRRSAALLTPTAYVGSQLVERLGAAEAQVRPTLLAADPQMAEPESLARFGELGKYLFYVGNMYPYKNVGATIEALAELGKTHPDVKLIAAGKKDAFSAELEAKAKAMGLVDKIKFVGFVSDGEMVALYRGAAAYVNPSLSEGFGLQGLEAMAQSTPVVAARASCLPEVYGDAAEYFDAADPADQARVIAGVLDDAELNARLRAAGPAHVAGFSWRRMAEQTLEAYKAAVKG
jgi:glycosyltransferase involved in cell wall biosynthesis